MGHPREPQLMEVQSLEFDHCDELVAAVGEASYQPALRHICGSDRWEDIRCEVRAVLVPEPANEYDPNAVMVQVDGHHVGYLSRDDALDYQPVTAMLLERQHVVVCNARICGRGPGSETANLGIFLELPAPDDALDEAESYFGVA